jgi:hypothetical protein
LRAEACSEFSPDGSELRPDAGLLDSDWILEPTRDVPSPASGVSTTDIAFGAGGSLYVVDRFEAAVQEIDSSGSVVRKWGRTGDGPGEFRTPSAIAVGTDRHVYVAESGGRISIFSDQGQLTRTLQFRGFANITDIVVLPSGNIVIARDVHPSEPTGAYVSIVDTAGRTLQDVLSDSRDGAGQARPLLGRDINPVQLTAGAHGQFAVWYPMDSYVEVFDSIGNRLGVVEGCMPQELIARYAEQARRTDGWQTYLTLTFGVSIVEPSGVRVISYYGSKDRWLLRLRLYSLAGVAQSIRDFDFTGRLYFNRVDFSGPSSWIAYNSVTREAGIQRFRQRDPSQ